MTTSVTPAMIDAALAVLREHFDLGGSANVRDYLHDGQTEDERAAGIAAMKAEDERLEAEVRSAVSASLTAALAEADRGSGP